MTHAEEIASLVVAEEKRLKVGDPEFLRRHTEIMDELDRIVERNLTKDFIKRIYGYELTYPGFADQAIVALEAAGCSKARQYYEAWVSEYETTRNAELKEVAAWYQSWSRQQEEKEVKEVRKTKQKFQNLTRRELTELCRKLLSEGVGSVK